MSEDAVGAVLNGQWRLNRLIGEGGLAAVYEADGVQGQGLRAIKMLHAHYQAQRSIVERFYTEAKACYVLRHPHIATVESYGYAEDGTPFIVMELLEGLSIAEFLARSEPLSPTQAVPLVYGVLQALALAHARGIVHRDLKPANIFMQRVGGGFIAKVLDFGIAKVIDAAGGMGSKTRTGAVLGTPGYMSPEQFKNAKGVDARTDLWALSVVFYEMMTCRHPFESEDKLARMVAVLREPPRPISELAPVLAPWDPFFQRGLSKDPEGRFKDVQEMLEVLRSTAEATNTPVGGEAAEARPVVISQLSSGGGGAGAGGGSADPTMDGAGGGGSHTLDSDAQRPRTKVSGDATQISGDRPTGVPTYMSGPPPAVQVVTAARAPAPQLVWWVVVIIALSCLLVGYLLGYLVGAA